MRPAGDVKLALLKAAAELVTPTRAPTLRELAERAGVGTAAARKTLSNMLRAGDVVVPRQRVVDYRNRPVCEYAPARSPDDPQSASSAVSRVLASWTR